MRILLVIIIMSTDFCTLSDVAALAASVSQRSGTQVSSYALYKVYAPHLAPLSVGRVVIHFDESSGSAEITENGDVYNPTFYGALLGVLFDWTKRLQMQRQLKRTNLFRDELIITVLNLAYIKASFVPVQ